MDTRISTKKYRILRYIYSKEPTLSQLLLHFNIPKENYDDFLYSISDFYYLVKTAANSDFFSQNVFLTDFGILCVEQHFLYKLDRLRSWITTIIAVAAFFLSIISIYLQYR